MTLTLVKEYKMKILLVLSLVFAAVLALPTQEIAPSIVGGVNAIPGEFPYIASIQWVLLGLSTHVCGGSIMNNIWVLSAAHCFTETPTLGRLDILVGKHNLALTEADQVRVGINRAATILHPEWTPGGGVGPDDLVLVRFEFISQTGCNILFFPPPIRFVWTIH